MQLANETSAECRCQAFMRCSSASLRPRSLAAAQRQRPPQRVGAPVTQTPAPQPVESRRRPRPRPPPVRPARRPSSRRTRTASTPGRWASPPAGSKARRLQFASELARVLDDGDNMRVLPIVTRGPFDNVYDLLYLRGVDAAIVYGDVLDHFKAKPEFANAWRRINYLLNLFPSEAHVFVRPEIKLAAGPRRQGGELQYPGHRRRLFRADHLQAARHRHEGDVHSAQRRHGEDAGRATEVAATFWISSKPLAPFLKGKLPEGFKFLPIEYSDKLEYYAPAYLEHADYPALIPQGRADRHHLGAGRARRLRLAQGHRPLPAPRARRRLSVRPLREAAEGARLPREMEGREPRRQGAGLAAVQALAGQARQGRHGRRPPRTIDPAQLRAQAARAAPNDPTEQERLFKQFLEWNKKQSRQ